VPSFEEVIAKYFRYLALVSATEAGCVYPASAMISGRLKSPGVPVMIGFLM
jgi:hypothetical protein